MSATGDMRGPQGEAGPVRPRQAGHKRQRRSVCRSKRKQNKSVRVGDSCTFARQAAGLDVQGKGLSAEVGLHAEIQSSSGQAADKDSEPHLGAEASKPPLPRGR
ncbi:hypothetical protein F443_07551 [Phytophthora nicotianae P1569]|uniref:Uncharacterized protein n=1 Tax=Phytophthora nicotianae P1569 TaxID=1317065 RepID=V9FBE1_PHYNI|nr:hypothetical protein F443_07551 [Phytophthora nicotianae P1569]